MPVATQVTDPGTTHGEGPVWDPDAGQLWWVDVFVGDVLRRDAAGAVTRHRVAGLCAAVRLRRAGGLVVGVERGFALVNATLDEVETLPELWRDPGVRMNDGACDPQGRFYCGSMPYAEDAPSGALYRLDPDRTVEQVLSNVTISNGLAWSPDGSTAYYVDTPTQTLDAFDFDETNGRFSGRRTIIRIDKSDGSPDGIAVDSEGSIWVATWTGGTVRRYAPTGLLQDIVTVPAKRVTACAFGGPDMTELFITTSRSGLEHGEGDPIAGALFAIQTGIRGLPLSRFAG